MRRVVYDCDWCGAEAIGDNDDALPATWTENGWDSATMCPACMTALNAALWGVREARKALRPKPQT